MRHFFLQRGGRIIIRRMVNLWLLIAPICLRRHGSLSTYPGCFPFPFAVATGPFSMFSSTLFPLLVTHAGLSLLAATSLARAFSGAVNLATVTMAANNRQSATVGMRTQKEAARCYIGASAETFAMWTKLAIGDIMPAHSCPARTRGAAPIQTLRV
jgi:hypothetical protein